VPPQPLWKNPRLLRFRAGASRQSFVMKAAGKNQCAVSQAMAGT
jgi:hypothetical protein